MSRFIKFFVIFMLIIFIVPHLLGRRPIPLEVKLQSANKVCADYYPFPSFPAKPDYNTPTDFIDFILNSPSYILDSSLWLVDFFDWGVSVTSWFFNDIDIALKLCRVFFLNYVVSN